MTGMTLLRQGLVRTFLTVAGFAALMAGAGTASASAFVDDSHVEAKAGQTVTDWININPFKAQTPSTPGAEVWYADTEHYACFLSMVGGDFNGGGEQAFVYQDRGSWAFGARSGSGNGVISGAGCVEIPDSSYQAGPFELAENEYLAVEKNITLPVPHTGYDWSCFLSGVRGKFQGSGEGVSISGSGRNWKLYVWSMQRDVWEQVRCVQTTIQSSRFETYQNGTNFVDMEYAGGSNYYYPNNNRNYYPTYANPCFLQKMTGRFEGAGEQLRVVADGAERRVNYPNHWWFELYSQQDGLAGSAQCVW